ncbi:uncharacterized protein [Littorina saxatilis]|uniref:Vesicular, overexpressed in cancer, prosurvival protein 1 n=1 Tax=Littorina saxatilis TaxID=31220 RepID=A0AAN9GNS5_9CAEN
MAARAVSACVLFAGLPPAFSLEEAVLCGGVHCYDSSAHCCTDALGNQSCCYEPLIEEAWFWTLVVIGVILIGAMLLCLCRGVYRYHNAGQYTKLRLQQPGDYGSIPSPVHTIHIAPPPISASHGSDNYAHLPSYAAVMGRAPPAYSEREGGR